MPILSMFYGVVCSMYFEKDGQHHTPHFHAKYGEYKAEIGFDGEIISGGLPPRQAAYVKAWTLIHSDELSANWELVMQDEQPFRIDPLK